MMGGYCAGNYQVNSETSKFIGGRYMKLTYPAIFYQGEGGYAVEVPDLPGCASGGETLAEAIIMGTDAASGWVLTELEDGKPVPKTSDITEIHPDRGGFVSMLVLDMDSYANQYGNKAVRKNLTIPAWLNTFAESRNINFSQVLQESLFVVYVAKNVSLFVRQCYLIDFCHPSLLTLSYDLFYSIHMSNTVCILARVRRSGAWRNPRLQWVRSAAYNA
jgi:predicted RNase H-like HicB family nuclease